jgi:DNA-binding response OmpR family regulator
LHDTERRRYNKTGHDSKEVEGMAKKKILIVDDEPAVTDMLKMNLEMAGEFEVRAENSATNVLNAAREFRPNLILLDVMMPDKDGGDIANDIKRDEALKNTPVVFLTAAVTKEEAALQDNKIGGYPFIAKPVGVEELIACIKKNAA